MGFHGQVSQVLECVQGHCREKARAGGPKAQDMKALAPRL